ncbi:MAG: tRNA lysidine(34) synthetase TilS [Dehalococcoidales bacterium]|nr:tRNA lysidine(34) synthetase TilS [Dehalococcoidales bacterium]
MKRQGYQQSLEQRVLRFIWENHQISDQNQLLVAVSGGPDSVCLLHILANLREELDIKLHVAHLDHQLRGAESEADAVYVSQLARELGIPATIASRDVEGYRVRQRASLEEAARDVRYTFLAEVAESIGTDRVAVGHTSDDQVETILMHLIRGTGTRGLRGLQPNSPWGPSESNLTIVRPLLSLSRQETIDYCCRYRLEPRSDATNLSLSALRNKIRHQLVPLLESYNPRIDEALIRMARIAGDDLTSLNKEGLRLWGTIAQKQGEAIVLDRKDFLELPSGLKRHLLRESIEQLLGDLKDIEARHIEAIIAAARKPAGKMVRLPGGLVFIIEYDRFLLAPVSAALSPFPVLENEVTLKIPGETLFSGWRVTARIKEPEQMEDKEDDFSACFCLDKVGDEILVRSRQAGDRFQPLSMSQSKKLGEFMIDAKIPRAWRDRIPIVCSPHHILWVVGWRIDDRAKATRDGGPVLCLEFEKR